MPNKRLYNYKELEDDHGLNWYHYGARYYDPQLGRWHVVDPAASAFSKWSPYNYSLNNPIRLEDKDGSIPWNSLVEGRMYGDRIGGNAFGNRIRDGKEEFHPGIDLGQTPGHGDLVEGTAIRAAARGKVIAIGYDEKSGGGYRIVIDHGFGYTTTYCHLKEGSTKVEMYADVGNGEEIGSAGHSGNAGNVHLHYNLRKNGKLIDPESITDVDEFLYGSDKTFPDKFSRNSFSGENNDTDNSNFIEDLWNWFENWLNDNLNPNQYTGEE